MPHIIVGTAGHIDHGKTALVKALTGIDADRLKEEKERGITIDIGFANLVLDGSITIGFIDVPGHERFIKNMLAGVGGIDLVMLVIASDESVMPQTREHLDICSLLHIKQGFTVLTKIDHVEQEMVDLVEEEVREFLKGSFLEKAPILRASSLSGQGIPQIREMLKTFAAGVQPRDTTQLFRLPIDRCFTMKGFGTVVTGTLVAGRIQKDQEVEIFPQQKTTRVRGIQVYGQTATEAAAGQRTALNLQGVEVAEIQRGMVVTVPHMFEPTSMLDCYFELLPSAPNPIHIRKRIRLHIGTAELMGYVVLLGKDRIEPAQHSFVQIRLEQSTFALPGDRFIIRQYSPMITIGGGEVLDAFPGKHRRSEKGIVERLRTWKTGGREDRLMLLVADAGLSGATVDRLAARLGLRPGVVREQLMGLAKAERIRVVAEAPFSVVDASAFAAALQRTAAEVKRFHQKNPLVHGIAREELKTRAIGEAPGFVFQTLLDALVKEQKLAVVQDLIHEFGRKVTLKADEEHIRRQMADRFLALGLAVPSPDEVIAALKLESGTSRKILQLLIKENVLVKVSEDIVVHCDVMSKLIADLRERKPKNPKLGVAEFKELTGVSRKYAIPLLEYLDRQRITRRMGEERVIL
jgi:selenocysteine-specific elongation factor